MKKVNLKDFVVEYQNGNEEVLNKLITLRMTKEQNSQGDMDTIYRLRFTDKALHNIYLDILKTYHTLDGKDIDSYVLAAFTSLLDKVDTSKSPEQIVKWYRIRLNGLVQNAISKDYPDHIVPETLSSNNEQGEDDEQSESSVSRFDVAVYEQFKRIEDNSGYKEFISFIGGDVEKILSHAQRKVYRLIQNEDLTQQDIATELNCSQANVNQHITALSNRIKKEYISFRTYKALAAKPDTYRKINEFIGRYNTILKYDTTQAFDYYSLVYDFIKEEVLKNEARIEMDFLKPEQDVYGYFNRNKPEYCDTVTSVLLDRCNKLTFSIVQGIVNGDEMKVRNSAKDKFVMDVLKIFNKYIIEINGVIKISSHHLVENRLEENNKFIDIA